MPSVTIDTCVLAAPQPEANRTEILTYVETLLDWKKLLNEPWIAIYMSENAASAMLDEGVYPLRPALRNLFTAAGIYEYDANTVARLAEELLRSTPSFETYFKIQDILVSSVDTVPDLLGIHTAPRLTDELARCLVIIAILRGHCRVPITDHNLIITPAPEQRLVHVRALIHDLECERDDILTLPTAPEFFQGEVLVCHNFHELLLNLVESRIWETAEDEVGLELATRIAVYKFRLEQHIELDWDNITGFRFGQEFLRYKQGCDRAGSPGLADRILRALAETIDGVNLRAVHAKRTGAGGGNPQELRGSDKAWRRDIDYEYHLHYWECADGMIEFASVGPHNMFEIPA